MKRKNGGFSLIELIIVIAIMASMVGILAPQFLKYVEKAKDSKAIQTADTYRIAVEAAVATCNFSGDEVVAYSTQYPAPSRHSGTILGEAADSIPASGRNFDIIAVVDNFDVTQVIYHDIDTHKVYVWYLHTPQGPSVPVTNQPCHWHQIDNDTNWLSAYAGVSGVTWNN